MVERLTQPDAPLMVTNCLGSLDLNSTQKYKGGVLNATEDIQNKDCCKKSKENRTVCLQGKGRTQAHKATKKDKKNQDQKKEKKVAGKTSLMMF